MKPLAAPFIGLWWFLQTWRVGFRNNLSARITRMCWNGKPWRMYAWLLVPYALIGLAERLIYSSALVDSPYLWIKLLPILRVTFEPNQILLAVVMAWMLRDWLASRAYQHDVVSLPISRRHIFQSAVAGYLPLLLIIYFLVDAVISWTIPSSPNFSMAFSDHLLLTGMARATLFFLDLGAAGTGPLTGDAILIIAGFGARLMEFSTFLLLLWLKVFLIVRAETLWGGLLVALIVTCPIQYMIESTASFVHGYYFGGLAFAAMLGLPTEFPLWVLYVPQPIPLLLVGIVWYIAQRRFERGPLPVEGEQ